jgi:hypothetical protein
MAHATDDGGSATNIVLVWFLIAFDIVKAEIPLASCFGKGFHRVGRRHRPWLVVRVDSWATTPMNGCGGRRRSIYCVIVDNGFFEVTDLRTGIVLSGGVIASLGPI